ncbi:MAG: biotin--[acetyl-CoA-carboxylase] ligase [Planctomycetes bacterium]|nr:biotin--[acetyl-CoA-carboxylase] ligase [Planctomycetota bacterium]
MPNFDNLDHDKIKNNLKTKLIGKEILIFNSTSSTNDIAAEYAKNKKNNGLVVFTEEQTKGRGRAANKWITEKGDSLLCSVLLTKTKINGELLSLTTAVAVADAISQNAKIKWPNDITLNNKKIAGILLESKQNNSRTAYIIGIGINCHQTKDSLPDEIKQTATSLDIETNSTCDRISLAKRLLTSLDQWLKIAEKKPKKVIEQWQKLSILLNKRVTLIFNDKQFTGNCIGIDPEKGLILQLDSGGVRIFDALHTSIAK